MSGGIEIEFVDDERTHNFVLVVDDVIELQDDEYWFDLIEDPLHRSE